MSNVRILDGGMGQEIYRRIGRPEAGWPLLAAVEYHDLVRDLHCEFLDAGADIICTNTYSTGRWRMNTTGLSDRFAEANLAAASAAEEARELVGRSVLIAGSLGPVRQSFQADTVPDEATVEREYLEQAILLAPHVDVFLAETLTTTLEARAAVRACASTGRPVWIAYTLDDTGAPALRGGEPIEVACLALQDTPAEAILINCTTPEAATVGLPFVMRGSGGREVGVYANGFEPIPDDYGFGTTVHDLGARTEITPERYAVHAKGWISVGATIVGGCCEVGPAHIAAIARLVREE